jgi:hypothetical protein
VSSTQNIRSGNMRVSKMKEEIIKRLAVLGFGYNPETCNPKVKRQLDQGYNFLDMISKPPYSQCSTVSTLTEKIKEERQKLQEKYQVLDVSMPGHQFSLFETIQEVSQEAQDRIAVEQMLIKQEIDWLHKCLGICKNRDYFN